MEKHEERAECRGLVVMTDKRRMERLEEMSREELIEEIIINTQRLEEMKAARKEERQIAELKKHENLLTDMEKAIKNGLFDLSEFKPQLQEFFRIKDERIEKLRRGIEAMINNYSC